MSKQPKKTGTSAKSSAAKAKTEKKASSKLPSFGFADDLLKKEPETSAAESTAAESTAKAAGVGGGPQKAAAAPNANPERIFTFADTLAAEAEEGEEAPRRLETHVTFSLAGELFALPVRPIREVLRVSSITRVPHAPYPIRGVTNLRGRVIPVIDLRRRIDLPPAELDRGSRILVVSSRNRLLGLLVDGVEQVIHLDLDRIQPPPQDVMTVESDYITGVYQSGEQLLLLLDVDRVLIIHEVGAA